jgi:hypothetical protein
MGAAAGPKIVNDNLILSLDPANSKSYRVDKNLLNPSEWTVGTGSTPNFNDNGRADENVRIIDKDPFGNDAVIWECRPSDSSSNSDGGWNSSIVPVDENFMYRFSVWVKRDVLGDGHFYLGNDGYDDSSEIGVLRRSSGSGTTNYYFEVNTDWNDWSENELNKWYLAVAHQWPSGSGTGADHPDTGIYDLNGNKISNDPSDSIWKAGTTRTRHRCYLYYSVVNTTRQQMVYPRIDKIDGSEPSVEDLINNKINDSYLFDISGNGSNGTLINDLEFNPDNNGNINFNGTNGKYIDLPVINLTDFITVFIWVNLNSVRSHCMVNTYGGGGSSNHWILETTTGNELRVFLDDGSSGNWTESGFTLNTNQWYQVGFTYDNNGKILNQYVNGEKVSSNSITKNNIDLSQRNPRIGARRDDGDTPTDGVISNCSIYDNLLTDEEIKQNFQALRGRYGI